MVLEKSLENIFQIDGCLFYHKRAHYVFGRSPLVTWLKPYMLPEILAVDIPNKWIEQKPANYSTYQAHIDHIQEVKQKRADEIAKREQNREQRRDDRKQRQKQAQVKAQQYKMDVSLENFSFSSQGQTQGQGQVQNETMEAEVIENGNQ